MKLVKVLILCSIMFLLLTSIGLAKFKCNEIKDGQNKTKYLECIEPPEIKEVYGTEYVQGQNGTVFVQLLNPDTNQPFNASNIFCSLKVFSPDINKTLVAQEVMINHSDGIFYKDFRPVFDDEGVYILTAECFLPTVENSTVEYFRSNATNTDFLSNESGNSLDSFSIATTENNFICGPPTGFQEEEPFIRYTFIEHINAITYWRKGGPDVLTDLRFRVFRRNLDTLERELIILQQRLDVNISSTVNEINFSIAISEFLFINEKLEVDFCARRGEGSGLMTVIMDFNGNVSMTNSSLTKYTIEKNASGGFFNAKGSGELHVHKKDKVEEVSNVISLSSYINSLPIADQYCVTDTLKKVEYYAVIEIDGEPIEVSYEQNFTCAYGCVNATDVGGYGECNPSTREQYEWIIVFVLLILGIIFFLRWLMKRA